MLREEKLVLLKPKNLLKTITLKSAQKISVYRSEFCRFGCLLEKNIRGKHCNRPNKISNDLVASANEHIKSFPARESHYFRNENKRKYLPADLTVKECTHYLEKYEPEQYRLQHAVCIIKHKITSTILITLSLLEEKSKLAKVDPTVGTL